MTNANNLATLLGRISRRDSTAADDHDVTLIDCIANAFHIDVLHILPSIQTDALNIRISDISSSDATKEGGELVAVGHFDGKKVEMAMWDEIKNDLKEGK